MKLAITGATGFVGRAALEAALGKAYKVRALARSPQKERGGVEWIRGALSDAASLARLVDGVDAVIHIAGLTNTPPVLDPLPDRTDPSGALIDNPDMPQLNFQQDACLQCGLCKTICPESAITLVPELDLSDRALSPRVLNEEEPFACIECGALFGVKSTVERIMEKLAGSHPMFASSEQAKMIQMCDDCRVQAQFHSEDNPFTSKPKPKVVTTDDYFSKRKDH